MIRTLTALSLTFALAAPVLAQTAPVQVEFAWSRATPPRAEVGALYMTLTAPVADRLVGVSTPAAAKAEVHEMSMANGVMRMRELTDGLALPPGQKVTLAPGGFHIMLMGLKAPLKEGQMVPVHLTFAAAPPLDVTAQVRGLGATAPR